MSDQYKTILATSKGLYKEKGSKFIAFAFPLNNEQAIKDQIDTLRKQYHDARHHCYAWRLGADMKRYRVKRSRTGLEQIIFKNNPASYKKLVDNKSTSREHHERKPNSN